ncbi:MAG: ABC transporter ATP-binding protein [Geodermatophilaceae bacterium]|jgi:biotin transport system ATP-binding protein|nr:ABC transporter ATP-binding protein [Geodermatophilaceae bacterium]
MITVEGVSHRLGERRALDRVTVSFAEHRVGVIGANGSGKSTFARLLNGLIVPDSGRVTVDGLSTARDGREIRRKVGFVFTDPDAQIVMPTVAEDVAFGLRRSGLPRAEIARRVTEVLARFGLAGFGDRPAHLLSGGEKQLLALCSVLVTEPATVVCDEPTTLLDLRNARLIGQLLVGLPQRLVLVTHDLVMLADFDRVLVFDDGRLVADGVPAVAAAHYRELMR